MCVGHHRALPAERVRRISPIVPRRLNQPDLAPVGNITSGISDKARQLVAKVDAQPAVNVVTHEVQEDKPVVQVEEPVALESVTVTNPEVNPKKAELIGLFMQIDAMERNGKIPGKRQSEKQLWITRKIADFLQIYVPDNAERNFGKSEGFRRNLFTRIKTAAESILGKEDIQRLPDFIK